jgi:hypothetical protein
MTCRADAGAVQVGGLEVVARAGAGADDLGAPRQRDEPQAGDGGGRAAAEGGGDLLAEHVDGGAGRVVGRQQVPVGVVDVAGGAARGRGRRARQDGGRPRLAQLPVRGVGVALVLGAPADGGRAGERVRLAAGGAVAVVVGVADGGGAAGRRVVALGGLWRSNLELRLSRDALPISCVF